MRTPIRRLSGPVVTALALVGIAVATLTPSSQDVVYSHLCLVCGEVGGVDIVLNLALFIPLGVGLALLGLRTRTAVTAAFAVTLLVEVLQLTVVPGRDSSLGDIVCNTVGGALGFAVARAFARWFYPRPLRAGRWLAWWMLLWVVVQALSSFAFLPSLPPGRYFGQLRPALGGHPPYPGDVHSATIGGDTVPGTEFPDTERIRALLSRGGAGVLELSFGATATAVAAPTAVVRIADDRQREILVLGVHRGALVFGTRIRGEDARLRPLRFALRDVLPSESRAAHTLGDTARVSARYNGETLRFRSASVAGRRELRVRASPAAAWRLVTPWQTYVRGDWSEGAADFVWVTVWFVPAGIWLRRSRPTAWARGLWAWSLGGLAGALMPLLLGLSPPLLPLIAAPIAGTMAGWGVASRVQPTRAARSP